MSFNRRTLAIIVALAAVIQTIIILYNNSTGFITLHSALEFLIRLAIGVTFSAPVALAIFAVDVYGIRRLDRILSWDDRFAPRLALEAAAAAAVGALLGALLTVVANELFPYADGLRRNVKNNGLIAAVINLIIAAALEAVLAFRRTQEARSRAETLERENSRIRFETLKMQLSPHFMFNSLNVLSSLIQKDGARAQRFVDEFASVYRYALDVIDLPVVEVARELEFARSYLYLLDIRFENAVLTEIRVAGEHLGRLMPPLALQTVLENAFKHNRVSEEHPLCIRIISQGETLEVANTLQLKQRPVESNGVGLDNLRKRYAFLGGAEPRFAVVDKEFVATLPLLAPQ